VIPCWSCDLPAEHHHHVVPRILGGTRTIPLCAICHGKAHGVAGFRNIGSLTKAALDLMRIRGERVGSIPYGSQLAADGRTLEANATELRAVDLARQLRAEGLSLRAIGARLTAAGCAPRGGNAWNPNTVSRLAAVAAEIP